MRALVLIVLCGALLAVPGFASANIVFNGSFETGDFTGWILSGNPIPGDVDNSAPHSGQFAANLFAADSPAFMEQQLTTQPGAVYKLTFFLDSDGETPNRFSAEINGSSLFDQIDIPAHGYAAQSFLFTATGPSTSLKFGFRNDPGEFHLDDIAVDVIPEPSVALFLIALGGLWIAAYLRSANKLRGDGL